MAICKKIKVQLQWRLHLVFFTQLFCNLHGMPNNVYIRYLLLLWLSNKNIWAIHITYWILYILLRISASKYRYLIQKVIQFLVKYYETEQNFTYLNHGNSTIVLYVLGISKLRTVWITAWILGLVSYFQFFLCKCQKIKFCKSQIVTN